MALDFFSKLFEKKSSPELFLTNTLLGKKEVFVPLEKGKVRMYNCGPTVYNYAHIGNLRSYVFADILRRTFEYNGYEVKQVINITDVGHLVSDADSGEDKMTKALKREGKPMTLEAMKEVADFYTEAFKEDLKKLNIDISKITFPKATEHIKEQIELIGKLEKKGFIYTTSDAIYFDTSKFPNYGKLGNIKMGEDGESRIGLNSEKKHPQDFALWKFDSKLGWPSPWGQGFPGWHIECSAMSMKYLGESFDVHTGGIDHIPVHHNNEIAQSESATSKPYAKYWLHHEHVIIDGGKMAKSGEGFLSLKVLIDKNIPPLAYRYWLLGASYRTKMDFSFEAVEGAQNAYKKLVEHIENLGEKIGKVNSSYTKEFQTALNEDLNTPIALSLIWKLLSDGTLSNEDKRATLLDFDRVLGLGLAEIKKEKIPTEIEKLVADRETARKNKDFKKSDELRDQIKNLGYEVKDTEKGPEIRKI
jgi:cysteinyl-tRNA synthetase